jgi:hypothetical protein
MRFYVQNTFALKSIDSYFQQECVILKIYLEQGLIP